MGADSLAFRGAEGNEAEAQLQEFHGFRAADLLSSCLLLLPRLDLEIASRKEVESKLELRDEDTSRAFSCI